MHFLLPSLPTLPTNQNKDDQNRDNNNKGRVRMIFKLVATAVFVVALFGHAWAMNSLVRPADVQKMKEAGIGNAVIETLVTEQTCTVTADHLIRLKQSGADDKLLQGVVLADLYKSPEKGAISEADVEILKKAGFSEEAILQQFVVSPVRTTVDSQGNESIVYGPGSPPKGQDLAPCPSDGPYNINIEKLEKK